MENMDISRKKKEANMKECEICHKKFCNKSYLRDHIASVHEGKKPFKCSICDYKYSGKSSLTRHIASMHQGKK